MAPRDPNQVQLDFPQLTADLIAQLRLTGTVGLLNFSTEVVPVFIVGDRDLSVDAVAPLYRSAEIFSGSSLNPVANTVVADTGQLVAGDFDLFASISATGTGIGLGRIELQLRNAANTATLAVLMSQVFVGALSAGGVELPQTGLVIAENERLRFQTLLQTLNGSVAVSIGARRRPIP